jgi:hypothetical protein
MRLSSLVFLYLTTTELFFKRYESSNRPTEFTQPVDRLSNLQNDLLHTYFNDKYLLLNLELQNVWNWNWKVHEPIYSYERPRLSLWYRTRRRLWQI